MMNATIITALLLITASYAAEVVNVVPGIFSKKVVSNGLHLPASNTYSPINILTTTVHLDKSYSIFVFTISFQCIYQTQIYIANY